MPVEHDLSNINDVCENFQQCFPFVSEKCVFGFESK